MQSFLRMTLVSVQKLAKNFLHLEALSESLPAK